MTDRNGIRVIVEELLGSEGSREQAERITASLINSGGITFDESDGFRLVASDKDFAVAVQSNCNERLKRISAFSVVDFGVDGAQYFPGDTAMFSDYDHVQVGQGENFAEAIQDALSSMAEYGPGEGCDIADLEARIKAEGFAGPVNGWQESVNACEEARKANGQMTDEEWDDMTATEGIDVYYYVSIRYSEAAA